MDENLRDFIDTIRRNFKDLFRRVAQLEMAGGKDVVASVSFSGSHDDLSDVSPDDHHDPVTLGSVALTNVLDLNTQELDLDTQIANTVFAGPAAGADGQPTFRALVDADIPGVFVRLDGTNQASWIPNPGTDATQDITGHFNLSSSIYDYRIGDAHALSMPGTRNLLAGAGAGAVLAAGGTDNVLLGYNAGAALTSQDENVIIGSYAAAAATGITYSTVIGVNAYAGAGEMQASVFIANDTYGVGDIHNSVVIGWGATGTMAAGSFASGCVIIGFQAGGLGGLNSDGNTLVGYYAGYDITTGDNNTAVGSTAAQSLDDGIGNVAVGEEAAYYLEGGDYNTVMGMLAGQYLRDANYCTLVGAGAGQMFRSGGATAADYNTALGYHAAQYWDFGQNNVVIGALAGGSAIAGDNTLNENTVIGAGAGYVLDDGAHYNTFLGYRAGYSAVTSDAGVFLGYNAGYYETGSSKLFIDNAQRASEADARIKALIYGVFDAATANQYLTVNGNLIALESITLSALTPSTVIYSNAARAITSLANGAGVLTNDGAGGLSWAPGGAADPDAIHDNVAGEIAAIANKAAPVAADMLIIEDSEALDVKKMIYLDDLPVADHTHTAGAGDGGQLDWDDVWSDAVHDHSDNANGGTFDAANLTAGASTDGQVLTSDGAGGAAWEDVSVAAVTRQTILTFSGDLTISDNPLRIYNQLGAGQTISEVFICVGTAPVGANIIVDVHKDGVTIFTNQAHRPEIAAAAYTDSTTDIDVSAWADGSYLTAHIDQIGGATVGADLVVHIIHS